LQNAGNSGSAILIGADNPHICRTQTKLITLVSRRARSDRCRFVESGQSMVFVDNVLLGSKMTEIERDPGVPE
jgi:hypothetical protein